MLWTRLKVLSKSKKGLVYISVAVSLLITMSLLIPAGITYIKEQQLIEPALEQFSIEVISKEQVDDSRIRNTIIPLYKKLISLREMHDIQPYDYDITVYLFDSLDDLQQLINRPDWVSASVIFYKEKPPDIYIPLEEEGGFWEKTAETPNPAHEITHVAVYEIIKPREMSVIPRSFHEGIAQYESLKRGTYVFEKFGIRLAAVVYRDELRNANNILYLEDLQDEKESQQLYTLSYIFIDYLANKHDDTKLWDVIKLVGMGHNFDESFCEIYGISYSEYFNIFLESYFGD